MNSADLFLDESQRAMVGARIEHIFEDDARKRQEATQLAGKDTDGNYKTSASVERRIPNKEKVYAAEKAAKMVNSSPRSVTRAKKVLKSGIPELVQAVENGKLRYQGKLK